ncbi:hypothetical protein LMG33810_000690 [Carnimonas sp. LMG 33810]
MVQPPTANRQPPTANRQPPTANRQPPTANRQPRSTDLYYSGNCMPSALSVVISILPDAGICDSRW